MLEVSKIYRRLNKKVLYARSDCDIWAKVLEVRPKDRKGVTIVVSHQVHVLHGEIVVSDDTLFYYDLETFDPNDTLE